MEEDNKISVWAGTFNDEQSFKNYIAESYDDDGEMSSKFMNDFDIDYYDVDVSESLFSKNISKSDFVEFSYSESFIDKVFSKISNQNSFLVIYDFQYDGDVWSKLGFAFLGSFDYVKS